MSWEGRGPQWYARDVGLILRVGPGPFASLVGFRLVMLREVHVPTPLTCVHRGSDQENEDFLASRAIGLVIGFLVWSMSLTPTTSGIKALP